MLQWYNCTKIYVIQVKYSIKNILIGGHVSWLVREKATEIPQNVAQVTVNHRFEHHTVFIGCQHQCYPHYCRGQGTGGTLTFGNMQYHLQRVQFVVSRFSVFTELLRSMDRSNTMLGEGANRLF